MKRKAIVSVSIIVATIMMLCIPASAVTVKKAVDPYFGKYEKLVTVNMAVATNIAATFKKGDSYKENVWTREYKKQLNIDTKIKWTAVDDGTYETKINLAIASNDLPDIMNLRTYSQFDRLYQAGKLVDLTPYYEKYAYPLLKKNLNEGGGVSLEWGKIGGKMMGLSVEAVNYMSARMVYIRHDWFVKSGLPKPKTMEDVIAIAKAFKAQDTKRFGIALNKQILNDTFCDMVGIANAMGAYPRQWLDDGKGKIKYGSIQPEMKKTIQLYADLYKDGLIDPSFASIDGGKVGEQLTNGTVGVVLGAFWLPSWPLNSYYEKDGVDWDIYPLMKSTTFSGKLIEQTDAPKGRMLVVRKGFSNPEALFKMLNFSVSKLYDPARVELTKYHSDPVNDPGHSYFGLDPIAFLAGPLMTNFNSNPNITNAIDKKDMSYLKAEQDKMQYPVVKGAVDKLAKGERATASEWAMYKFFYGPDSTFGIQNKYFADDSYFLTKLVGYQSPEMIRSWSNLIKLEDVTFTAMISGTKPVSDFDKFVKSWKDLGGEVVEYEVNDWYKAKMGK